MYDELVALLRKKYDKAPMVMEAADAIEELSKRIPPVPHGRLIEAEPIMKYIADGLNSGEFGYDQIKVLAKIQYAPTIIPAEEATQMDGGQDEAPAGPYDILYEEGGVNTQ